MNKQLNNALVLLVIVVAMNGVCAQTMVNLTLARSALLEPLAYIEKTVQEKEVKIVAQRAQLLVEENVLLDSLAATLIDIENFLNFRLAENLILNLKPYKPEMLFALYENTANLLQTIHPQNESLLYASAVHNLAIITLGYFPHKSKSNGDSLMKMAFRIREKYLDKSHPDYAESLIGMATVISSDNAEKALPLVEQAIALSVLGGAKAKKNCADGLRLLGTLYTKMHRYDESARVLEQENEVQKDLLGAESAAYALRLYRTGNLIYYTGEYQTSLRYYKLALALTRKTLGEKNFQYAYCLDGVASLYYSLGDYRQAIPLYLETLKIKEELGDRYSLPLAFHQLATAYVQAGLYAQALPLFQKGVSIAKEEYERGHAEGFGYGHFLSHLANLYRLMHQYGKAYSAFRKAFELTTPKNGKMSSFFHAVCTQKLAAFFENINRYDSAAFYMRKVLMMKEETWGKNHFQYATGLYEMATFFAKQNRLDTALLLCKQSADIRKEKLGIQHPLYASSLALMGELYTNIGLPDSANFYLLQAFHICEKSLSPEHPDYIRNVYELGRVAMARGEKPDAVSFFNTADTLYLEYLKRTYASLSEEEKLNLVAEEGDQFGYLPSLLLNDSSLRRMVLPQVYAAHPILKGMVLDDQQQVLKSIRSCNDSSTADVFVAWKTNRALLAKQYLLPTRDRLPYLDSLQEATNSLEEDLVRRSSIFRHQKKLQKIGLKNIAISLQSGEAAIEFIRFRYYNNKRTDSILYAAIVVLPGDTAGVFVPLFEEKELQSLLQPAAAGNSLAVGALYTKGKSSSKKIYRLVWEPIEKYLEQVHTIHFAPTGLLHSLSFQAIHTMDNNMLIEKYRLHRVFSTRTLFLERPATSLPSAIGLWGNIAYNKLTENNIRSLQRARGLRNGREFWMPLPATQQEVNSIRNMCTKAGIVANVVSGKMATEERFKQLDGNSPEVLHIATHGSFQVENSAAYNAREKNESTVLGSKANAMLGSSLIMAGRNRKRSMGVDFTEDEILTAYEIAQMDLSKTSLAVLSACYTALGNIQGNEGVIGLQRALKLAGVKQMVISLWKVPDKETAELMRLFYQALLSGQSTREALRTAQLQMSKKYLPFYWAAFVLVE